LTLPRIKPLKKLFFFNGFLFIRRSWRLKPTAEGCSAAYFSLALIKLSIVLKSAFCCADGNSAIFLSRCEILKLGL
jgi:hypothetical protein